jgi:hypothetical protein
MPTISGSPVGTNGTMCERPPATPAVPVTCGGGTLPGGSQPRLNPCGLLESRAHDEVRPVSERPSPGPTVASWPRQ